MKTVLFAILVFCGVAFAESMPGVQDDTQVVGTPRIAQKFCVEDHRDVAAACAEWTKKIEASLGERTNALILKSACVKLTDLSIGTCMRTGSLAGIVEFIK